MAKRPALTDSSFLSHIFSPKKAAQPTGLRKTHLSGKGWNGRRLRAFNRMPAVNQEILKRSGQRDAYLKGETSLADAKRSLRPKAISLGVAKPTRSRTPGTARAASTPARITALDRLVRNHINQTLRDAGKHVNVATVRSEGAYLVPTEGMLKWDYGRIKYEGRQGSDYEVVDSTGQRHNPLWYH
jgi:hypothetical protein